MPKRRRWDEEVEERERSMKSRPELAQLDEAKRAGVLEELQRAGGNTALQQVVGAQALQREAAPVSAPSIDRPFMRIKSALSGAIRGPSKLKGHEGEFELVENYELEAKQRKEFGQATGQREYSELKVVVRKSVAITQLRQALARNEPLETIVIMTPLEDGVETATFLNGTVVGVKDLASGNVELRFTFQKITWGAGGLETEDSPVSPR